MNSKIFLELLTLSFYFEKVLLRIVTYKTFCTLSGLELRYPTSVTYEL